jgi:hypothetical protein
MAPMEGERGSPFVGVLSVEMLEQCGLVCTMPPLTMGAAGTEGHWAGERHGQPGRQVCMGGDYQRMHGRGCVSCRSSHGCKGCGGSKGWGACVGCLRGEGIWGCKGGAGSLGCMGQGKGCVAGVSLVVMAQWSAGVGGAGGAEEVAEPPGTVGAVGSDTIRGAGGSSSWGWCWLRRLRLRSPSRWQLWFVTGWRRSWGIAPR